METTKVTATAKVANVTSENIGSEANITDAVATFTMFGKKNGEIGIRTYGFLASVVELTDTKAKDMVDTYGVDKGRLSKAGKCLRFVVAEILSPEVVTPETYQQAIEYLVETYESLNGAYSDLFPTEGKDMTEEQAVKNLFAAVDKYGLDLAKVLLLIADEVKSRQGE